MKTEEKIKLIQTERCKKKNRRVIRKSKRRRRKYKKIQWERQDVKQTEKWIEILKESSEVQKTLEKRRPLDNTNVEWTQVQLNLLAKGQKFIPTPKKVDRVQKFKDFLSFAQKLRLAIFFIGVPRRGVLGKYQKVHNTHGPRQVTLTRAWRKHGFRGVFNRSNGIYF